MNNFCIRVNQEPKVIVFVIVMEIMIKKGINVLYHNKLLKNVPMDANSVKLKFPKILEHV